MTYKLAKVNIKSYSSSGYSTNSDYCDYVLHKIRDLFINANSNWQMESDVENIGTNTDEYYGTRTIQLRSSLSGKYLRIWMFSASGGQVTGSFVNTPTNSGDAYNIKLYINNCMSVGSNNDNNNYYLTGYWYNELYFAVSSNPIGSDFGLDLGLESPIFALRTNIYSYDDAIYFAVNGTDSMIFYYGCVLSVITDGNMFFIMTDVFTPEERWPGCLYAPDLFINVNENDIHTDGAITSFGRENFYAGPVDVTSGYLCATVKDSDGNFVFKGQTESLYNPGGVLCAQSTSNKIPTSSILVSMKPITYTGSQEQSVYQGVGIKGWINPKYLRCANPDVLPSSCKGMTFANGGFLCTATGTLICFDKDNESPFEPATD